MRNCGLKKLCDFCSCLENYDVCFLHCWEKIWSVWMETNSLYWCSWGRMNHYWENLVAIISLPQIFLLRNFKHIALWRKSFLWASASVVFILILILVRQLESLSQEVNLSRWDWIFLFRLASAEKVFYYHLIFGE